MEFEGKLKGEGRVLSSFINAAMDAIIVIDADQRIVQFNPAAEAMFGYTAAETLGDQLDRFLPERYRAKHHLLVDRFRDEGTTGRQLGELGRIWGLRADGTEFPIEATIGAVTIDCKPFLSAILRDVREKLVARDKLDESERKLTTLLGNLPGIAYRCKNEPNWPMIFASEGGRELTGYGPEELTSGEIDYGDLIHAGDRERVWDEVQACLLEGVPYSLEYRIRTRSGALRWMSEHGTGVSKFQGERVMFLEGIITDVTARKDAETILKGRHSALRKLARGASLDEVLLELAKSAEEVFPAIQCSVLRTNDAGTHLVNAVAPSLPKSYLDAVDYLPIEPGMGSCGSCAHSKQRVIVSDVSSHPHWRDFRETARQANIQGCWSEPIFNLDGEIIGVLGLCSSEVRAPEAREIEFMEQTAQLAGIAIEKYMGDHQLLESEQRFRAIFEQQRELVGFVDTDGLIIDCNQMSMELFGVHRSEFLGNHLWDVPWRKDEPEMQARLREAVQSARGGEAVHYETDFRRPSGEVGVLKVSIEPIYEDDSTIQLLLATGIDVTEKRRAHKKLQESERRAHEAEKLASIAILTAGIAHDIGAPMTAILGYAEMMQKSLEDEKNRKRAGIIIEQINRITELVQALLNMARAEELSQQPLGLQGLVETSLDFYREMLRKRGIGVQRNFSPVLHINGDTNRLQQAILNIFVNAADAMREGGTLTAALASPQPDVVELRISDTGVGISPEDLPRIFEPFYTTKQRGQGTGLGLLVTKSIVDEHNGSIEVESTVGQGTTFVIRIPVLVGPKD